MAAPVTSPGVDVDELALFAGAGGGILGGHLLGWRTRCAVEFDPYARSVLLARQRDGFLPRFPIWDDVKTFDGHPWKGSIDVCSGGFPCQDISSAGRGAGIEGEKSGLWGEMARIVCEVRPRFVFVENSPMLTSRGLGVVLGDLASMGYDARWCVLGAHNVGAPHKRDRIWILAHAESSGGKGRGLHDGNQFSTLERRQPSSQSLTGRPRSSDVANAGGRWGSHNRLRARGPELGGRGQEVADADGTQRNRGRLSSGGNARHNLSVLGSTAQAPPVAHAASIRQPGPGEPLHTLDPSEDSQRKTNFPFNVGVADQWKAEPDVGRVAHGVARRVDRLKCLGNGQVPAVAALAWTTLGGPS